MRKKTTLKRKLAEALNKNEVWCCRFFCCFYFFGNPYDFFFFGLMNHECMCKQGRTFWEVLTQTFGVNIEINMS